MHRQPVQSSSIASVGYDAERAILEVEFVGGRLYRYFVVSSDLHAQLMAAASKGRFFNDYIRDAYPCERLARTMC